MWNSFEAPVFTCSTKTTDELRKAQNEEVTFLQNLLDANEITHQRNIEKVEL